MHSIPVEVSAHIVSTKRQKTKNGLPQLTPILDSSQPDKDVVEVNVHESARIITSGFIFTVRQWLRFYFRSTL